MHLGRWELETCSDDWVYDEEVREEGTSLGDGGKVSSFMMGVVRDDVIESEETASGVVSCGFFTGEAVSIFSSAIVFSLF